MKKKSYIFEIAFLALLICACSGKGLEKQNLTLVRSDGKEIIIRAEMALTAEQQQLGYMERKKIPDGTGMLFVFKSDEIRNFWMKNTPTALSIAYIDSTGRIRNIFDMQPYSLSDVTSTVSVRYALEVPQGWFDRVGIKPDDRLVLDFSD